MNWHTLDVTISGAVATVTLNRPRVHNAFNETAIKELEHSFRMFGDRDEVRVIVLTGSGTTFCAGADLSWMKRMAEIPYQENFADAYRLATMLRTLYHCPKPVIARVQGDAYGGGLGLIAVADIAIASSKASFGFSEVKLGLMPAVISPFVIQAIGSRAARRYFVTGERFTAQEACRIGLVHEVVTPDVLDARLNSIVTQITQSGPQAVIQSKRLIQDIDLLSEKLAVDTAERIARLRGSEEAREGVQAFLEKRRPSWAKTQQNDK
ncbi:MAG: enoyl-CoA hydratase/isomerase family protein [Chthoniobacterales bacterium]